MHWFLFIALCNWRFLNTTNFSVLRRISHTFLAIKLQVTKFCPANNVHFLLFTPNIFLLYCPTVPIFCTKVSFFHLWTLISGGEIYREGRQQRSAGGQARHGYQQLRPLRCGQHGALPEDPEGGEVREKEREPVCYGGVFFTSSSWLDYKFVSWLIPSFSESFIIEWDEKIRML